MRSIILSKVGGKLTALWKTEGGVSFAGYAGTAGGSFLNSAFGMILMTVALLAFTFILAHLGHFAPHAMSVAIAGVATTVPLKKKKEQLVQILKELETGQKKLSETGLTQEEGDALEAKAKEGETLQKEIETAERVERLIAAGKEVDDPTLPEGKRRRSATEEEKSEDEVVGYISVGALFAASSEYKSYLDRGMPLQSGSAPMKLAASLIKAPYDRFVTVTRKMRREFEQVESKARAEQKAIPTLTTAVIQRDRIAEVVRTAEPFRLRMRDVLNVSRTDSNMVEYLQITASVDVAAPTAENTAKPERTMSIDAVTAPVRTEAVWMPVTEQQLQDAPQVTDMVDNELLFDLARLEEKQFLYGSGAGENLQGLLTLAGVPAVTRLAPGDPGIATQNVDRIRIAMTDIMVNGGEPNALVIHPIDWEQVILLKGTDTRYIWAIIDNGNGPRIWGLSVVETTAALKPGATERNLLVGDFVRGATVWDRQDASVAVGFVNDDFIKNRRTVRAEERLAFGIKRPLFFEKYKTAV